MNGGWVYIMTNRRNARCTSGLLSIWLGAHGNIGRV